MSPAFSGSDRENVDVPIEGKMPPWFAGGEIGDDIWHDHIWRDDPVGDAVRVQQLLDVASSNAGVARRVGRWTTDEFLKKGDQELTITVDALEQAAFLGLHRLLQQFLTHWHA